MDENNWKRTATSKHRRRSFSQIQTAGAGQAQGADYLQVWIETRLQELLNADLLAALNHQRHLVSVGKLFAA